MGGKGNGQDLGKPGSDGDRYAYRDRKEEARKPSMRKDNFRFGHSDKIAAGSQFNVTRQDEMRQMTISTLQNDTGGLDQEDVNVGTVKTFDEMRLRKELRDTLNSHYIEGPTAVQVHAIPTIRDLDRDFVIRSPTGSGKTAAFLVPIINRIMILKESIDDDDLFEYEENNRPTKRTDVYAIIVAPSRDLAIQLYKDAQELSKNTGISVTYAVGEISVKSNTGSIMNGCDIVVGTVGRLAHFIFSEKLLDIDSLLYLVVDEADRLERMEDFRKFYDSIREAKKGAKDFHIILSSATMDFQAGLPLRIPILIEAGEDEQIPPATLVHAIINVNQVPESFKDNPILSGILPYKYCYLVTFFDQHLTGVDDEGFKRVPKTMVYVNGKHRSDALAVFLLRRGYKVFSFHGNRTMEQRTKSIERMKTDQIDILISTDILSRGLNMNIEYVINYDLPRINSSYSDFVHRVGRTARVGNYGVAITFFDARTDAHFACYLQKILEHYGVDVPGFLSEHAKNYYTSILESEDHYIAQVSRIEAQKDNVGFVRTTSSMLPPDLKDVEFD